MISLRNKFAAWTAVAALGAASLFAAETSPAARSQTRPEGRVPFQLSEPDASSAGAAEVDFPKRRGSPGSRSASNCGKRGSRSGPRSRPIMRRRSSNSRRPKAAKWASWRPSEATAMAKVYQILTPDQQQKLAQLRQARMAARQAHTRWRLSASPVRDHSCSQREGWIDVGSEPGGQEGRARPGGE